jgi:hypothetical protein
MAQDGPANPEPSPISADIDRIFNRGAVGSSLFVGREGSEAHDLAVELCHKDPKGSLALRLPGQLVLERARHKVKSGSLVLDFVVVDTPNGVGVGLGGMANM